MRFSNMQQEVYRLRKDHEEAIRMAAKCQDDSKEAGEMVKR